MAKYFIQFDGNKGNYIEAETVELAKAKTAIQLEGFQSANNPKGTARLLRIRPDGKGEVIGTMRANFQFEAA